MGNRCLRNSKEQYDQLANVALNEGIQIRDLMRVLGLILRYQALKACDISVSDTDSKTRKSAVGVADTDVTPLLLPHIMLVFMLLPPQIHSAVDSPMRCAGGLHYNLFASLL